MSTCEELILRLDQKDQNQAYKALQELEQRSRGSDEVSQFMDSFLSMLDASSSYVRTRGLRLLFANAKWNKMFILQNLATILSHIEDEKPITSRTCIKGLVKLVKDIPQCAEATLNALQNTKRIYQPSMQALIYKDREQVIRLIEQYMQEYEETNRREGK